MDPIFWLSLGGILALGFEHYVIPWGLNVAQRRARRARRVR